MRGRRLRGPAGVVPDEEVAMGDGEQRAHGYDFSKVEPARIYTLKEAGELLGMGYGEVWRAHRRGCLHTVRATWNEKAVLVRGSELLRVMKEEFVACQQ